MNAIDWLLEDDNPAVKYRTQREILGEEADPRQAIEWVRGLLPDDWQDTPGLWYTYYLTALAECGLTRRDVEIDEERALRFLREWTFEAGCADFMQLRALAMLGFLDEPLIRETIDALSAHRLPDGGYLCLHRANKLKYTPKSCYKANLHALMFLAECAKRGLRAPLEGPLLQYFWEHRLFYRRSDPEKLVIDGRPGWRAIDIFHPFEAMRVGLHNIVEALCALGYGHDARLNQAWGLLADKRDEQGIIVLEGTPTKSYLKKERAGKFSKWATFYAALAEKECSNCEPLPTRLQQHRGV